MSTLILGIAGGSASGKTTIARRFAERVGATLLGHDRYYRDAPDPRHHDFDHPDALETALLVRHLAELRRGRAVDVPVYDFATHRRAARTERIAPGHVLVVEGILVLADPALRRQFDHRVYVDADDDVRLVRRMRRDRLERDRTYDQTIDQWSETVRVAHRRFVAPSRRHARVRLDGQGELDAEVDRLVALVRA